MLWLSQAAIPLLLLGIPLYGLLKKQPVYELFCQGAAEGVTMAVQILPYLLAMLVAVGVLRASGAFLALARWLSPLCQTVGLPPEVLPLALLRPLSGGGALAITAELLADYGPDSFIGRLASVMQGSTDTTCYILAVYFGSVGVKKYRYALAVGLAADAVTFISAFCICRLLFPC
ncbi:MAG: spore maturation protein [Firmicutes bacterium]|nr:spore maturation protein [Bacillota bacterium]